MSSNIEDQDFWKPLAYTGKQQAKELIKLKKRLTRLLNISLISIVAAIIYFAPLIFGKIKATATYMYPMFIFLLIAYCFTIYISHVKKEYEDVRKQTIAFIKNEGCSCMDKYCPHKDQFIEFMSEVKHINLSY